MVGSMALYLDDVLIGSIMQTARKSKIQVYFIDKAAYDKLQNFLLNCIAFDANLYCYPPGDLDTDIGDTYSVCYNSELVTDTGKYQGRNCTIVEPSLVRTGLIVNSLFNLRMVQPRKSVFMILASRSS
jgi:hypothetical protein